MRVKDIGRHDCASCALGDVLERRDFLREAVARTLIAVTALATLSDRASALNIVFASGTGARTDKAYPVPAADSVQIDREESVIIARVGTRAYAFSLACPHQNTAIRWEPEEHRYQCPKHHSKYQPDGVFIEGRATRSLDRFAIRRDCSQLLVNLDALYRQDENTAEWTRAFVDLGADK